MICNVFNTQYLEIKLKCLKKIASDKIKGTKNALSFLSRAPAYHSLTFNLRFLYELKHKVRLSKSVCGIFHFRFRSVFITVYQFILLLNKKLGLSLTLKRHNSFHNTITIIEKPQTFFFPDLWFFICNKKFYNFF